MERTGRILATALIVWVACAGPRAGCGDERCVDAALSGLYVHGVDAELAATLGPDALPRLLEHLADPDFPRRDNVVAFLAYLGDDRAVGPIAEQLRRPATLARIEDRRAWRLLPEALARIGGRGHVSAREALFALTDPARDAEALTTIAIEPRDRVILDAELISRLRDDLAQTAVHALTLLDGRESYDRLSELAASRARPLADEALRALTSRAPLERQPSAPRAIDTDAGGFCDSSAIEVVNHVDVDAPIDAARVDQLLDIASSIMATDESAEDVACCAEFVREGPVGLMTGAGLDVITAPEELADLLLAPGPRVRVIDHLGWCDGPTTNSIGCALVPGAALAVTRVSGLTSEAVLWLHEYGHNVGLNHRNIDGYVMNHTIRSSHRWITAEECPAFHAPPEESEARLTRCGLCHDDDGDDWVSSIDNCAEIANPTQDDADADDVGDLCDNCASHYNPEQVDLDGDESGDACDNCRLVSNASQSDADEDGIGDACDLCPDDPGNDSDGDGQLCDVDVCPFDADDDLDDDGICGDADACPGRADDGAFELELGATPQLEVAAGRVAYLSPQRDAILVRSTAAGLPWRVALPAGESVDRFDLSADGERLVYLTDDGLWRVAAVGGARTRLGPAGVSAFVVAPDDDRVAYVAGGALFVSDNDDATQVSEGAAVAASTVTFTPDSTRLLYGADTEIAGRFELYGVRLATGARVKLSGPMAGSLDVDAPLRFNPSGGRVVYRADQDAVDRPSLYGTRVDGAEAAVRLHPLPSSAAAAPAADFHVHRLNGYVFFRGDTAGTGAAELWRAPLRGGTNVRMSPALAPGGAVDAFAISPDGDWILFRVDTDGDGRAELWKRAFPGGPLDRLDPPQLDGVESFVVSADSAQVVFLSDTGELWSAPLAGGPALSLDQGVTQPSIAADGASVFYLREGRPHRVPIGGGPAVAVGPQALSTSPLGDVLHSVALDGTHRIGSLFPDDDADGDAVDGACDCAAGDATLWALPSAVASIALGKAGDAITVQGSGVERSGNASGVVTYELLATPVADDWASALECPALDRPSPEATLDGELLDGRSLFLLMRAVNGCGGGPTGRLESAPRRLAAPCATGAAPLPDRGRGSTAPARRAGLR